RGERDQEPARHGRRHLAEDGRHDLGLDGEDHDVDALDEQGVVRQRVEAVAPRQLLQAVEPHVGDEEVLRRDEPGLEQAPDEGLAHVAATEEADLLALDRHVSAPGPRRWPSPPARWSRPPRWPPRSRRSCPSTARRTPALPPSPAPRRGASAARGSAAATPRGRAGAAGWS